MRGAGSGFMPGSSNLDLYVKTIQIGCEAEMKVSNGTISLPHLMMLRVLKLPDNMDFKAALKRKLSYLNDYCCQSATLLIKMCLTA